MNQTVKAKWVAALRSGEYRKGDGSLLKAGCFCVMGVLCDLYTKENGHNAYWLHSNNFGGKDMLIIRGDNKLIEATTEAPEAVMEWAGLDWYTQETLININDDGEVPSTFSEMADIIEADKL